MHLRRRGRPALPDLVLPGLELRLDEHEASQPGSQQRAAPAAARAVTLMNETSHDEHRGANGELGQLARVRPLQHGDARVVAELRVQLAVADVERDHARGAALEQAVGEAARRGADVERSRGPSSVEAERVERVRELLAAARDVRRRPLDGQLGVLGHLVRPACRSPGTSPASTSACACARLSASPRSTSRTSSRFFTASRVVARMCYTTVVELRGDRVVLRPLAEADVARLVELGADPEVARWWPGLTHEHVLEKARGEDNDVGFAIVVEGEVAGLIQHYEEPDADYRHAGIDLFLGVPYHDRGFGTDAVRDDGAPPHSTTSATTGS